MRICFVMLSVVMMLSLVACSTEVERNDEVEEVAEGGIEDTTIEDEETEQEDAEEEEQQESSAVTPDDEETLQGMDSIEGEGESGGMIGPIPSEPLERFEREYPEGIDGDGFRVWSQEEGAMEDWIIISTYPDSWGHHKALVARAFDLLWSLGYDPCGQAFFIDYRADEPLEVQDAWNPGMLCLGK